MKIVIDLMQISMLLYLQSKSSPGWRSIELATALLLKPRKQQPLHSIGS